ncbi:carbohydrate ABC transporter permease [Thermoanaerobacter uzonensis]|uniref:carbohydrate ABC transporter permease n=1 Tax=Thermoanaerobacter uzonensis TaxID=447593 RepID=UPI003D7672EB
MKKGQEKLGWLFASPYLVYSLIFFVIPLFGALFLSFTNWNLISPQYENVGFLNFIQAVKSPGVKAAFFVTYKFMIIFVPMVLIGSLVISLIINSLPRFKSFFSVGYFLPYLASGVATSVVVKGILSYNSALNVWLRNTWHLNIDWLGSQILAPLIIAVMISWKFMGYYSLILTSGLESISGEVYEAAAIDGATGWIKFFKITLPLLYPAMFTVTILAVGLVFGIFTEPYVLTGGGPGFSTNTWQIEIYNQAFSKLNAGYGSAIAIIDSVVTFVTIIIVRKLLEIWGKSYGWE